LLLFFQKRRPDSTEYGTYYVYKDKGAYAHELCFSIGQKKLCNGRLDVEKIAKEDTALAGIFTRNKLTPEQYDLTALAILQASGMKVRADVMKTSLPASSTVAGKNVELVTTAGLINEEWTGWKKPAFWQAP
jgi:phospholipase C